MRHREASNGQTPKSGGEQDWPVVVSGLGALFLLRNVVLSRFERGWFYLLRRGKWPLDRAQHTRVVFSGSGG